MADNNQDLKSSSKLPRLSKIQTSVPKLPTLHKAASPGAGGEKSIIPALSSNAAQVPVSNPLEALDDGEETQAIAAPSEAELEAAVAAMREQNHAADDDQEKTRAVTVHKSAAPAPIQVTAPAPGPAPIQKFVTKAPAKAEPKPAPAAAADSELMPDFTSTLTVSVLFTVLSAAFEVLSALSEFESADLLLALLFV